MQRKYNGSGHDGGLLTNLIRPSDPLEAVSELLGFLRAEKKRLVARTGAAADLVGRHATAVAQKEWTVFSPTSTSTARLHSTRLGQLHEPAPPV